MPSEKKRSPCRLFAIALLGIAAFRIAVAADIDGRLPGRPSAALPSPLASSPSFSIRDEDDARDERAAPTFNYWRNDRVQLIAAQQISNPGTRLPGRIAGAREANEPVARDSGAESSASASSPPLTLKKQSALEWKLAGAAAAQPPATPASNNGTASSWEIALSDITLNATISRWAAAAGWQLVWELPVDYKVDSRSTISGTFEEAVSLVARSMQSAEVPLKAIFYRQNKVVRIVAKGAQ